MKKKGFTLIELLAVILILAIIAAIISPIVGKIIDNAREQSDRRSAERYVKAAQEFYAEAQLDENKKNFLNSNIINQLDLENKNAGGSIVVYDNGSVEMAITINNRCFTKTTTQDVGQIEVSTDTSNCTVNSSSVRIRSITSRDNDVEIILDDTSLTVTSCKFGTSKTNLTNDCTVSGNTITLSPTIPGTLYYYEITFSDGSKRSGSIVVNPGETTYPSNGGGTGAGGNGNGGSGSSGNNGGNNSGGDNGGSGSGGNGGSGNGGNNGAGTGVAAPVSTAANGKTTYTGTYLQAATEIYFNVTTGTKCDIFDFTSNGGNTANYMTSGCLKFYAYMEDDLSYTMILDRNLVGQSTWAESGNNGSGPVTAAPTLKTATDSWVGTITPKNYINVYTTSGIATAYRISYETEGYKARFITSDEIAHIVGNTSFNSSSTTESDWFYLDGATAVSTGATWQTQIATASQKSAYAWLFNYISSCPNFGCNVDAVSSTYSLGYWTSDSIANTTNKAWAITMVGSMNGWARPNGTVTYNVNNTSVGIRPVITVLKSTLQ